MKERIDKVRQMARLEDRRGRRGAVRGNHQVSADRHHEDRGRHRRIGRPDRVDCRQEGRQEGSRGQERGAEEGRLRSERTEADGRAREAERAGVGIGRSPRSRTGSSGEGRRQPEPGEGHRVGRRPRRLQEGNCVTPDEASARRPSASPTLPPLSPFSEFSRPTTTQQVHRIRVRGGRASRLRP